MARNKAYSEEEVLGKAMEVFWKNGYEATSVRLLEKEMGINQFSIYSTFSSKKELFILSLKKYTEYVKVHRFHTLLKKDAGLKDLETFFHHFARKKRTEQHYRGCLVVNTTGELGAKDPDIAKALSNYFGFIKNTIKQVLQNAVEAGELSANADIDKYSNYLLGVLQGLSVGAKALEEQQIKDIVDMTMANIK
ncbi:MAG: TetR family transcriptional regulator [Bacteroidetes bacterium]|jgi:AcrR family transcriptional regulator|nr:TetR family transcriptional regulator [Bacteroidota bacterium]